MPVLARSLTQLLRKLGDGRRNPESPIGLGALALVEGSVIRQAERAHRSGQIVTFGTLGVKFECLGNQRRVARDIRGNRAEEFAGLLERGRLAVVVGRGLGPELHEQRKRHLCVFETIAKPGGFNV